MSGSSHATTRSLTFPRNSGGIGRWILPSAEGLKTALIELIRKRYRRRSERQAGNVARVTTFGFNQPQINRMYADKRDEEAGFGDVSSLKTVRAQSYPFFHLRF
jgi:hypothetical protein